MLHPAAQKALGFKTPVAVFEIERAALGQRVIPQSHEISKFPSVRRDLAFVLDKSVSSADLVREIREQGGKLVTSVVIFDVFTSEELGDKRSIALGLTLHDIERTLEDAEVDALIEKIVGAVQTKFGATLRA